MKKTFLVLLLIIGIFVGSNHAGAQSATYQSYNPPNSYSNSNSYNNMYDYNSYNYNGDNYSTYPSYYPSQDQCFYLQNDFDYRSTDGNTSGQVSMLQRFLISMGYLEGGADGRFGNKTLFALKNFQRDNALNSIGHVDSLTREKINSIGCGDRYSLQYPYYSSSTYSSNNSAYNNSYYNNNYNNNNYGYD